MRRPAMGFSGFEPPRLDLKTSALARRALHEDRLHVQEYAREGPYPAHRAEKDEVDAYVADIEAAIASGRAANLRDDLVYFVEGMFMPDEIQEARDAGQLDRLTALAALQWAIEDLQHEINRASLRAATPQDPVFVACPSLPSRLDKDSLVRLAPADVSDPLLRSQRVLSCDGHAVFPHPYLQHRRELISTLFDLTAAGQLAVSMAVHPLRICKPEEVQMRLLEDYWSGILTTPENLDSLDPHDNGVKTFHFAPQDSVQRVFHPMLGTWFSWERRSRNDPTDPVRRLYIQEVGPGRNRFDEPYITVVNPELHAERDAALHAFTHVDGKLAVYDGQTYAPTLQHPNASLGKQMRTRKLWRVDGDVPDRTWMDLVGCFFRGNDLIDEHFGEVFGAES
jgi:hypothetical protein